VKDGLKLAMSIRHIFVSRSMHGFILKSSTKDDCCSADLGQNRVCASHRVFAN
jgi:hypothetical protein